MIAMPCTLAEGDMVTAYMFDVPDVCGKPVSFAIWSLKERQLLPSFCLELHNTACF